MDFAVMVKGRTEEGKATWVLAVDPVGERVLVAIISGVLEWVAMADCILGKLHTPDQPILVLPVQPSPAQSIAIPNRAMRRNGGAIL